MFSRIAVWQLVLAGALLATACVPDVATTQQPAANISIPDTAIHVSATTGSNVSGDGTSAAPYKTIGYALGLAVAGDVVKVDPGTYDTANGETFPINVPSNVILVGDETNFGSGIVVSGGGPNGGVNATFYMFASSVIAGLTITDPGGMTEVGVYMSANNLVLRRNTVTGTGGYGVYITGGTGILIDNNQILGNNATGTTVGFTIFSPASNVVVQSNVMVNNTYAARSDVTAVDFGLGNLGSIGNNTFACSSVVDFYTSLGAGNTIDLSNNYWTSTTPNIYNGAGASTPYSTNFDYPGC